MMMENNKKQNRGFTLVEMMVSVAIFTIIMTVGIGALVGMMQKYKVSQQEKQAADSLNFVLENLTREIRLGYNYYSHEGQEDQITIHSGVGRNGSVLAEDDSLTVLIGFDASDNRGYIMYYTQNGILYRFKSATAEALTDPTQVIIDKARMLVINAGDVDDLKQPLVWIQFLAHHPERPESQKIIQTLVSQRILDI